MHSSIRLASGELNAYQMIMIPVGRRNYQRSHCCRRYQMPVRFGVRAMRNYDALDKQHDESVVRGRNEQTNTVRLHRFHIYRADNIDHVTYAARANSSAAAAAAGFIARL
jgi:hypothetical protein